MNIKQLKTLHPYEGKKLFNNDTENLVIIQKAKEGLEKTKKLSDLKKDDVVFEAVSALDNTQVVKITGNDAKDWEIYTKMDDVENLSLKCKILETEMVFLKHVVYNMLVAKPPYHLI
jgi:5-methylcytosine-specific restriction endonuclease McrBC regulatory subunit McrC